MTTYTISGANFDVNDSTNTVISAAPATMTIVVADDNAGWNYDILDSTSGETSEIDPDIFYANVYIDGQMVDLTGDNFFWFGTAELSGGEEFTFFEWEIDSGDAYNFFYQTDVSSAPDWTTESGMQEILDNLEGLSGPSTGDFLNFGFFSEVVITQDDNYYGEDFGDSFNAGLGSDLLRGLGGDDELWGGVGEDRLLGTRGNDTIQGNANDDVVKGGGGNDMLYGNLDNDLVRGGRGRDSLYGGDGDDKLDGGVGQDLLDGGRGADIFQFKGNIDGDTIADFEVGVDTLRISSAIWGDASVDTAQELIDTYGMVVDGDFRLDFTPGDTGNGDDNITFAGIANGDVLVNDILIF